MTRPFVIDGGLATGLEAMGHRLHPTLWSAGVFLDDPRAVEDLHATYLECGAEILITASYQMSFAGLADAGLGRDAAARAMRETVDVAQRASARHGGKAKIAASVGPYGAALADGSEYGGDYGCSVADLEDFHADRLALLADAGADLLACETIPSILEVEALCRLLYRHPKTRAWISLSCRDGSRLRDGSAVSRAVRLADACPAVFAVGVNCTAPRHVSPLMDEIRRASTKPIVVYPNSGEGWDARGRRWIAETGSGDGPEGRPRSVEDEFLDLAREWSQKGAWAIGGCCRIGPDVIRRLARGLKGTDPWSVPVVEGD